MIYHLNLRLLSHGSPNLPIYQTTYKWYLRVLCHGGQLDVDVRVDGINAREHLRRRQFMRVAELYRLQLVVLGHSHCLCFATDDQDGYVATRQELL